MYLTLYLLCLGLRCCWRFLEGSCNIVYFHSHWKRVLIAPHPQWLDVANFGSFDYSRSMTLFLTVVLICTPLMTIWNRADLGLIPGSGRPPGEGNGTPLQYSCLENPMDGGTWWAAVHGVARSRTGLSGFTFMHGRRKWHPTPVFLPGESQGRGSLVGYCLWGRTESDTTEAT